MIFKLCTPKNIGLFSKKMHRSIFDDIIGYICNVFVKIDL